MASSEQPAFGEVCDHESGRCITCSDEALPMRVIEVDSVRELALCAGEDGSRGSVEIALVQPVAAGDTLLVHAGTAIAHAAAPLDAPAGAGP